MQFSSYGHLLAESLVEFFMLFHSDDFKLTVLVRAWNIDQGFLQPLSELFGHVTFQITNQFRDGQANRCWNTIDDNGTNQSGQNTWKVSLAQRHRQGADLGHVGLVLSEDTRVFFTGIVIFDLPSVLSCCSMSTWPMFEEMQSYWHLHLDVPNDS